MIVIHTHIYLFFLLKTYSPPIDTILKTTKTRIIQTTKTTDYNMPNTRSHQPKLESPLPVEFFISRGLIPILLCDLLDVTNRCVQLYSNSKLLTPQEIKFFKYLFKPQDICPVYLVLPFSFSLSSLIQSQASLHAVRSILLFSLFVSLSVVWLSTQEHFSSLHPHSQYLFCPEWYDDSLISFPFYFFFLYVLTLFFFNQRKQAQVEKMVEIPSTLANQVQKMNFKRIERGEITPDKLMEVDLPPDSLGAIPKHHLETKEDVQIVNQQKDNNKIQVLSQEEKVKMLVKEHLAIKDCSGDGNGSEGSIQPYLPPELDFSFYFLSNINHNLNMSEGVNKAINMVYDVFYSKIETDPVRKTCEKKIEDQQLFREKLTTWLILIISLPLLKRRILWCNKNHKMIIINQMQTLLNIFSSELNMIKNELRDIKIHETLCGGWR
ncbi:putative signal peptide protein [Puccinia sorghi]|uniref:Putative signal peptide protein n=1 Tax=Puccinia sorghi TaxID=27349 RepID=A0A0L6VNB1_9BASI|nr:putative signal peptide protein [Puccinia sorghi]